MVSSLFLHVLCLLLVILSYIVYQENVTSNTELSKLSYKNIWKQGNDTALLLLSFENCIKCLSIMMYQLILFLFL